MTSPRPTSIDDLVQCAGYALEMLSHGRLRTHALGLYIHNGHLELLYYDRSIPLRSEPICFTKDPLSLVALLYTLQNLSEEEWGYSVVTQPSSTNATSRKTQRGRDVKATLVKEHTGIGMEGSELTLKDGSVLQLKEKLFRQHSLIGRGTCVYTAQVKKLGTEPKLQSSELDEEIVVKLTFTPNTRVSEMETLKHIVETAEGNSDYNWVLHRLPEILHDEAFIHTAKTQRRVSDLLQEKGHLYESRSFQGLVMKRLYPITDLTTAEELLPVIRDIFRCEFDFMDWHDFDIVSLRLRMGIQDTRNHPPRH